MSVRGQENRSASDPEAKDKSKWEGAILGRYRIAKTIAKGGMAEVHLARNIDDHLKKWIALKTILPHLASREDFVDMFLREARYIARVQHPNIVQILELGAERETYFIAMEYVAGASFRELMRRMAKRKSHLPLNVGIGLILQGIAGAHAAHEAKGGDGLTLGLVHRDISPHNLMLNHDGVVKLLDFGIAKATELFDSDETQTGALKGKIHYMSPEQCRQSKDLDRRSDVFALGIVAWEMLTSRRLFKRDSDLMTMQAIVSETIPNPQSVRPEIPDAVAAAVMRALVQEKEVRTPSAEHFFEELQQAALTSALKVSPSAIRPFLFDVLGDLFHAQDVMLQGAKDALESNELTRGESRTRNAYPSDTASIFNGVAGHSNKTINSTPPGEVNPRNTGPVGARKPKGASWGLVGILTFLLISALGLVAAYGQGWFQLDKSRQYPDRVPFRMVLPNWYNFDRLEREYEGLRVWLSQQLERDIVFVQSEKYEDLDTKLVAGEVEFAMMPPYRYLLASEAYPRKLDALVSKEYLNGNGTDGILLVSAESKIEGPAGLKGKRLCVPDLSSTTGYLLPRLTLWEAGLNPNKEISIRLSQGHEGAIRDLIQGLCDAAGTYDTMLTDGRKLGLALNKVRRLAVTGRSPQDLIVAGPMVSVEDKQRVRESLLHFDPKEIEGESMVLDSMEGISGFGHVNEGLFRDLKKAMVLEKKKGTS